MKKTAGVKGLFYTDIVTEIENMIAHLERQRTRIDTALEALRGLSDAVEPEAKPVEVQKDKRRSTSSEGRQRQIEGMRRYWAAKRTAGKKAAPKKATKKGGLTAAGRKALSDAMKKRWAAKNVG